VTTKIQIPPRRTVEILCGIDLALARCEYRKQREIVAVRWCRASYNWYRFELARERLQKAYRKHLGRYTMRELTQ